MTKTAWFGIVFELMGAAVFANSAQAASATGDWLVKDKTAIIRVVDCDGLLWGVVAWEASVGTDNHNPDPAKQTRPTLGMPVLIGMKASGQNRWDGKIYNARNGSIYTSNISLADGDGLRVRGCILGILCGGENWTRADSTAKTLTASDAAICSDVQR